MALANAMGEKDAARFLGVSPSFLAKRRVLGDGPYFIKYGGRRVVYLRSDLEAWRDARRRTATAPDQQLPTRAA